MLVDGENQGENPAEVSTMGGSIQMVLWVQEDLVR